MNKNIYNILIIIIFPYLYLFPHTFQFIEMGNDFELLYFSYKKYIYEFLKIFRISLRHKVTVNSRFVILSGVKLYLLIYKLFL